ncbi:MAG TPA: energy transducer TonB [Stellaceae bacterium]|nr:energy transducer TonB [Stellaceae bacterium]
MVTGLPPVPDMAAAAPEEVPESRAAGRGYGAPAWLASILLHALVIALLIGFWRWQAREEPPPIEIAFIPGTGAAGAQGGSGGGGEAEPSHEGSAEAAATPTPDASAPPSIAIDRQAAPAPQQPPAETSAAPSVSAPAPNPEPQEAESQPAADLPPPPPHKPVPPTRAAPAPQPPAPQTPRPPAPAQAATAPTPAPAPGTPGTGAGAGGTTDSGTGVAGAGRGAIGTGDLSAIGDDYLERLQRHIRRFLSYPQTAKQQKQQGEVVVTVLLRRDGTVLDAQVAQSSGYPLLDDAAIKAVRDSSKVPPFPDGYPVVQGKVDLPFKFRLGFLDRVFN